jgi:hypothetical protein
MKTTVNNLNWRLPVCHAVTQNQILVIFKPPKDADISLGDELEVDLEKLDQEQEIINLSNGSEYKIAVKSNNVHDLRLPSGYGKSRFPNLSRRLES